MNGAAIRDEVAASSIRSTRDPPITSVIGGSLTFWDAHDHTFGLNLRQGSFGTGIGRVVSRC